MSISINNSDFVEGSWSAVNKTALGQKLEEAGDASAIREAYLFVGDLTKRSTWKFPHHVLQENTLKPHKGGVHAAAQRLVSSGATATDIPKKAAARHLLKHYRAMGEDAPESLTALSKYMSKEEIENELKILKELNKIALENNKDIPVEALFSGIFEEIPELESMVNHIDYLKSIESLEDEEDSEESINEPVMQVKSFKQLVEEKTGILKNIEVISEENKSFVIKTQGIMESKAADSGSQKRTKESYRPTQEELNKINSSFSGVDFSEKDIVVFKINASNTAQDRELERFSEKALQMMAEKCVGKAYLTDHEWKNSHQMGVIFDAYVDDQTLVQKVYLLDEDFNNRLIKNMLGGVANKVSVGAVSTMQDMLCESCMRKGIRCSIYDEDCSHRVGVEDEMGQVTGIVIDGVLDYYETSNVPVPANKDAGLAKTTKSIEITGKLDQSFENLKSQVSEKVSSLLGVPPEKIDIDILEDKNSITLSTINIDTKSLGVPIVEKTEKLEKDLETTEVVESSSEVSENVVEEQAVEKTVESGDSPSTDNVFEGFSTEIKKEVEVIKSSMEAFIEEQKKALEMIVNALVEKHDSLEKSLSAQTEELKLLSKKVEEATQTTIEDVQRDVQNAEAELQETSVVNKELAWLQCLSKRLGGQ